MFVALRCSSESFSGVAGRWPDLVFDLLVRSSVVVVDLRRLHHALPPEVWTLGFIRTYLKWDLATVPPYVVFFASSFLALLPFAC
jgi:hypothetical protein